MTPGDRGERTENTRGELLVSANGGASFVPGPFGAGALALAHTPHTAGAEGRDGGLATDAYGTLTESPVALGSAKAGVREAGIEGQSSLYGGTHIRHPTSSDGRSKEAPAGLPALS